MGSAGQDYYGHGEEYQAFSMSVRKQVRARFGQDVVQTRRSRFFYGLDVDSGCVAKDNRPWTDFEMTFLTPEFRTDLLHLPRQFHHCRSSLTDRCLSL